MTDKLPPIHVTRTFEAPRDAVFRAFTDPSAIPLWLGGQRPGDTTRVVELDLQKGGRYVFQGTIQGKAWEIHGTYREVAIPEKLVYTWMDSSDGHPPSGESLVTVEFREIGGHTEVKVTHANDATDSARRSHEKGWSECFDALARVVAERRQE